MIHPKTTRTRWGDSDARARLPRPEPNPRNGGIGHTQNAGVGAKPATVWGKNPIVIILTNLQRIPTPNSQPPAIRMLSLYES